MLAITPGPDNLFVLTRAALRGAASGLMVVLGLCTGLILHTSLVAFGVAAIFQTSARVRPSSTASAWKHRGWARCTGGGSS
jgi:threonine/homoserine/homoserine lactone efflux protein